MKGFEKRKARKGQLYLYIGLLIAAVAAMLAISDAMPERQKHRERKAIPDTIHAALVYGPMSYMVKRLDNSHDTTIGTNYTLMKRLQDSLGCVVRMHPVIDTDIALEKLNDGEYDILASLPADSHLKEKFLTSREVYLDRLVLIQKRDSKGQLKAKSALDLENDTVHVEMGSTAIRRLENLQKEIGGKIYVKEEPGLSEELLALQINNGVWDYAVVNEHTVKEMERKNTNPDFKLDLDYSTPVSFTQFQVWVLPHGKDSLLNAVNKFLETSKARE